MPPWSDLTLSCFHLVKNPAKSDKDRGFFARKLFLKYTMIDLNKVTNTHLKMLRVAAKIHTIYRLII